MRYILARHCEFKGPMGRIWGSRAGTDMAWGSSCLSSQQANAEAGSLFKLLTICLRPPHAPGIRHENEEMPQLLKPHPDPPGRQLGMLGTQLLCSYAQVSPWSPLGPRGPGMEGPAGESEEKAMLNPQSRSCPWVRACFLAKRPDSPVPHDSPRPNNPGDAHLVARVVQVGLGDLVNQDPLWGEEGGNEQKLTQGCFPPASPLTRIIRARHAGLYAYPHTRPPLLWCSGSEGGRGYSQTP